MATTTIKERLTEPAKLAVVKQMLRLDKTTSRARLAQTLCERWRLRDQQGRLRVASCLKALRDLEREGQIRLPARLLDINSKWRPRRLAKAVAQPKDVPDEVTKVKGLEIALVDPNDETAMRTWNELILREHPQGERRLVGQQLRYLVGSSHGWLGAVGFSACALSLEDRDRWIGWDARERRDHRQRVVNLSRLLIRPGVRCRNLASTVLGACMRRLEKDFERRYGHCPCLVETFVDRGRYRGTCFQAANWQRVGETKGRGRNDREHHEAEAVKDIYVYPLVKDFRRRLGAPAGGGSYLRPLAVEDGLGSGEWVESEFGKVELGDKRLRDRLIKIVSDRSRQPDVSYLNACGGDRYAAKGYYAFVDSTRDSLNPEAVLAAHRERTIGRMMSEKLVLVVQDTTDLNLSTRRHTEGLGLIGTNQTGAQSLGLKLHTSLALTTDGLPLGVLRSVSFAPKPAGEAGKQSIGRPIEEKKSFRWLEGHRDCVAVAKRMPQTRLLTVMDREGDIFELFEDAEATRKRVGVLVRAKHDRRLEGRERKLFEELKASKERAQIEAMIPRQRWKEAKRGKPEQKGLPGRKATMELCFQEIKIKSTRSDLRSAEPITLWGVYAREVHPPAGAKRIEWFLLTTEPVRDADEAARIVDLYCKRWRIEEWHRVLKSGCKVQEHQNETAERLKRVIAIDAVLAWRIQLMTLLGREVPDLPCAVFFDEWEVKVLEALRKSKARGKRKAVGNGKQPLSLGEAIIDVAKMGGYLARGSDPPPGSECIWKGLIELCLKTEGYRLAFDGGGP